MNGSTDGNYAWIWNTACMQSFSFYLFICCLSVRLSLLACRRVPYLPDFFMHCLCLLLYIYIYILIHDVHIMLILKFISWLWLLFCLIPRSRYSIHPYTQISICLLMHSQCIDILFNYFKFNTLFHWVYPSNTQS